MHYFCTSGGAVSFLLRNIYEMLFFSEYLYVRKLMTQYFKGIVFIFFLGACSEHGETKREKDNLKPIKPTISEEVKPRKLSEAERAMGEVCQTCAQAKTTLT